MEFENLVKLIQAVSDSELTQFSFEEKGVSLTMKKEKKERIIAVENTAAPQVPIVEVNGNPVNLESTSRETSLDGNVVKSPLVGTFYVSPSPEEEPFVKVGDTVSKGQVLGIVEAMKLMNEIESEFDGVVKQILVSNEDVIEFGQPLFVIG
ncbi:MAG: acetyl-CoA carboxylase biotin carboxyl carrier protein [Lachnospiraceae bacterium]|jgi:acetyl-CoA carboxylase biotin carboxyl carrier protein|nr:acetyl-CoA carboxylase biotin carboxyl carrier protein [Lachnospiraceae bacterium]